MAAQIEGLQGLKLLMVDSEERFRTALAKRIQDKGISVAHLDSGIKALQHIKDNQVDVVVLDIKMPELGGIETLEEIKKVEPGIEVILLTGYAAIDSAIEGMRLGAYDYLMKPCELEDLLEKIQGAYNLKHKRDERLRKAEERSQLDKLGKSVQF